VTGAALAVGGGGYVDSVSGALGDLLAYYGTYAAGYGLADITYIDLLGMFGVSEVFTIYQSEDGDWYLDPANMPGGGGEPVTCE
jgi:hypothetical protein